MTPSISFEIDIDTSSVDKIEEAFNKAILEEGVKKFAEEIEWSWRIKAAQTLKTSKDAYLKGLSVEPTSEGVTVTLSGWLPVAVEQGVENFNMKPGLLGGALFKIIPIKKSPDDTNPNFKTVSQNSPKDSWQHPGIQARKIFEQVKADIDEICDEAFKGFISRIKI